MPVDAHIFATTDATVAEPVVRSLASDLAEALGSDRLMDYDGKGGLFRVHMEEYDFLPDGLPRSACILCVRLCTPYYGAGYERGYWPEIVATLEFLRRRISEVQVWYGPDADDRVSEVTQESLDVLWRHWATHGGRPYYPRQQETA